MSISQYSEIYSKPRVSVPNSNLKLIFLEIRTFSARIPPFCGQTKSGILVWPGSSGHTSCPCNLFDNRPSESSPMA